MVRPLLSALLVAGLVTGPAFSEPAAKLFETTYLLGAESATDMRNAAWASCVMFGHQQAELTRFLDEAGWSRDEEEGSITYSAPGGMAEKLWLVVYEGEVSCNVIDQLTSTTEARMAFGELIDDPAFRVEDVASEGECKVERVTLPQTATHDGFAVTLSIISGGDFGDCTSDAASAMMIEQLG